MAKEYTPKQFIPFIYPEWGELFSECSAEKKAEYLMAIVKYPNVEIKNDPIWNFIRSQLDKDFENFVAKCKKRGDAARNYWGNKGEQMLSKDNKGEQMLSSEYKGEPKLLTNNHLPLTLTRTETNNLNLNIPTKEEILEYANVQLGKSIEEVDDFINWYSASEWKDTNGLPINWKRKLQTWIARQDSNKNKQKVVDMGGLF